MSFKEDHSGNLLWEFSSFGEFLEQAENGKSALSSEDRASRSYGLDSGPSWDNNLDFKQALNMGLVGDIETADKIIAMAAPLIDKMTSLIERLDIVYSTEGMGIDIAKFVENDPECWLGFTPSIHEGKGSKIVSIYYNTSTSGGVSSETMKKKGMAVLVLVEALEMAGIRTEIYYGSGGKRANKFQVLAKIKEADQPLDRPRLAFIMANAACYRRLMFSVYETCASKESLLKIGVGDNGAHGYGMPTALSKKGDINIGESKGDDHAMLTNPEAWVRQQLEDQGIKLEKGE